MNASMAATDQVAGRRRLFVCACGMLAVAALGAHPSRAQPPASPVDHLGYQWLQQELKELKRLVFQRQLAERQARTEKDTLKRQRDDAVRFAGGAQHAAYRCAYLALLQSAQQSPAQSSLFQMHVPPLAADEFRSPRARDFPGGTVAELVDFVRTRHLSVRPGSRAQLVLAELSYDAVNDADARIAELDARIERYKAQNAAHNAALKELLIAAAHCRSCRHCWHGAYGCCGSAPAVAAWPSQFNFPQGEQPAGLQSQAYAPPPVPSNVRYGAARPRTRTDRLSFLKPPTEGLATDPLDMPPASDVARQQQP
jgi:uncharacterized small protein (DUF1192 family)